MEKSKRTVTLISGKNKSRKRREEVVLVERMERLGRGVERCKEMQMKKWKEIKKRLRESWRVESGER